MRPSAQIAAPLLLAAGAAWGDGISGLIEEDYTRSRSSVVDQSRVSQRVDADELRQRYRLVLDRSFFPNLRFNAGGTFEQILGKATSGDVTSDLDSRVTTFFGNLALSGPILSSAVGYNRAEQTSGTPANPFGFVSDELNAVLGWRPTDLPTLSLRFSRRSLHDRDYQLQDSVDDEIHLTSTYAPIQHLDLRYTLLYETPTDRLHHTDLTNVTQSGRVSYDQVVFDGRSALAAEATITNQQMEVRTSAAGGTSTTPIAAIAGYSLVEAFPAAPDRDTLVANPTLINGDVTASAGINLGTSRSLAGDVAFRDLGAQLADAVTNVNTVWVWVDKQLPPALAATMQWTAWQSSDNVTWTQVPIVGVPAFNLFQPRFEITIQQTQARYLKVVTSPLGSGVTVDPLYRDIFVTELQLFLVTAAPAPQGWQSTTGATLNASARTQIFRDVLAWDLSLFLTGGSRPGSSVQSTYVLINGLTFTRRLNVFLASSARVARQEFDQGQGHIGEWLYSASLSATPLPALAGSLVFSGRADSGAGGSATTNNLSLFAQAALYRGIALGGNASYGIATTTAGQTSDVASLLVSTTVQPHEKLTLTGSFGHSDTVSTGGGLPRSSSVANRLEATFAFNPVQALYLSAGITRVVSQPHPQTLGNATASFSPFQGGELQFGVTYSETLETTSGTTRVISPNVRWNMRHATLTLRYSLLDTDSDVQTLRSRSFGVNLRIPL